MPSESPAESSSEAASPFRPAFRWEASQPEAPAQGTNPAGHDVSDAERTRVVLSGPSYQQPPGEAGDLFQPVGTPLDQPTGEPGDGATPQWAGPDLPPIAEQQSAWLRQTPQAFPAPAAQPRSKQIIGIAVLGIVVLGLLGSAVAYTLTARTPDRTGLEQTAAPEPPAAAHALPAPPAPLPAPADAEHALIDPPGQTRGGGGQFDLPKLTSTGLLPPAIQSALRSGGMTDGFLKTTTVGSNTIGVFALTMPDQQAATKVAQAIATEQLDGGLKADDNRALQGVAVMGSVPGSQPTAYRSVYVLYNRAIYLEVFGSNREAVLNTFDSLLNQQVSLAPPTVRVGR